MKTKYYIIYVLLVVAQILLGNYLNLTQYVVLCFLPALIMSLPITMSTAPAMVIAFITGFAVDFFTHGILGLTIVALVPVAFCRSWITRLIFGEEMFARKEDVTMERQGAPKITLGILLSTALYFLIYIPLDGAGTRTLTFDLIRFALSLAVSTLVSIFIVKILTSEEVRRWR